MLAHYPKDKIPPELDAFDRRRGPEIARLAAELASLSFLPEPTSLIYIRKPGKPEERREISLVKPDDRIVLTLLNRLLTPLFERQFLPHNYGYRKGLGALAAVERVEYCLRQGLEHTGSRRHRRFLQLHRPRAHSGAGQAVCLELPRPQARSQSKSRF